VLSKGNMGEKKLLNEITKDLTVLCVDDEPLAREYLSLKLKRTFKDVYVADDGASGLDEFRSKKPDLIITDNRMVYMDGIEMIMQIREEDKDVPIILATAYTQKDALVDAINCNVTQFLSKPIDTKKLEISIEKSILPIINKKLSEKTLNQELELLKYREKYHSHQENNAFKKEQIRTVMSMVFLRIYSTNLSIYSAVIYIP